MPKQDSLPVSLPPRLLARTAAAAFVCVSPRLFDELVEDGRMPQPRILSERRRAWDVTELGAAVDALPSVSPTLARAS
jgi:predicted DNA-binding transcriptional regulator AlpA